MPRGSKLDGLALVDDSQYRDHRSFAAQDRGACYSAVAIRRVAQYAGTLPLSAKDRSDSNRRGRMSHRVRTDTRVGGMCMLIRGGI